MSQCAQESFGYENEQVEEPSSDFESAENEQGNFKTINRLRHNQAQQAAIH